MFCCISLLSVTGSHVCTYRYSTHSSFVLRRHSTPLHPTHRHHQPPPKQLPKFLRNWWDHGTEHRLCWLYWWWCALATHRHRHNRRRRLQLTNSLKSNLVWRNNNAYGNIICCNRLDTTRFDCILLLLVIVAILSLVGWSFGWSNCVMAFVVVVDKQLRWEQAIELVNRTVSLSQVRKF